MKIEGFCDDKFAAVREEFERNFEERNDVGATYAATVEGQYVIDLWGGYRDSAKTQPWQEDTIVNVWSTTKPMTALCALILADRGELDFDAPVSKYWPEYAQNGKEATLVRHFMGPDIEDVVDVLRVRNIGDKAQALGPRYGVRE